MQLPKPRGSLSERLFAAMADGDTTAFHGGLDGGLEGGLSGGLDGGDTPEDGQIALWALYGLHYRGFEGVEDRLEWDPVLLGLRSRLEADLERRLRDRFADRDDSLREQERHEDLATALFAFVEGHDGASVASYVQRQAGEEQVRQLIRLRSLYHLRESDPVAWLVPRLPVAPKAALMELQYDEYGAGDPNRLHAHLFARGMAAIGLDPTPFAYVDQAPVEALELNNAMSLLGLHRRLRGAALGHLAAFEATSSLPSRRMAQGLERLGLADELVDYYREHVEADAVHEQLAVRTICGALVAAEPALAEDVFLGAFTCLDLEDRFATWLLREWGQTP